MVYPNVAAEMARNGVRQVDLADALKIAGQTLSYKLNGRSEFTLLEASNIKAFLKSDLPIEVLFERKES